MITQDKVFVNDKVILRPKILIDDKHFQSGIANTINNINKSNSNKLKNPFAHQRRIITAGGKQGRSFKVLNL
jgi:hypothetical protein